MNHSDNKTVVSADRHRNLSTQLNHRSKNQRGKLYVRELEDSTTVSSADRDISLSVLGDLNDRPTFLTIRGPPL